MRNIIQICCIIHCFYSIYSYTGIYSPPLLFFTIFTNIFHQSISLNAINRAALSNLPNAHRQRKPLNVDPILPARYISCIAMKRRSPLYGPRDLSSCNVKADFHRENMSALMSINMCRVALVCQYLAFEFGVKLY